MRMKTVMLAGFCASLLNAQAQAPARKTPATSRKAASSKVATPPAPAARQGAPLVSAVFKGNSTYTRERLMSAAGLKLGQLMDKAAFDAMRERLLSTGALEGVGYEYNVSPDGTGYALVVEIREFEPTLEYRFEDLPASEAELRAYLREAEPLFEKKIPSNKPVLDRFAEHIRALSAKKGLTDTVIAKVVSDGPNELRVLFRPGAEPMRVAQVKFTGNKAIDNGLLTRTYNGVAIGARCLEPVLKSLLDSGVRPLYEARGMLQVAFPKLEISKIKDIEGCEVLVTVAEGPVFKYGQLKPVGAGMSQADMLKITGLKDGETANYDVVKAGEKSLLAALKTKGFMRATVKSERIIQAKSQTVDITYYLEPGAPYHFGTLTIRGLDIQNEPPLRKIWGLKPGALYRGDYAQYFLDQVKEQGLFDNLKETRFEEKIDDNRKIVDVTLFFR